MSQFQQSSTGYRVYQDPTYGFRIEYPQAWEIRKNTQVFVNGDTIAFRISGPTQKVQTELTDGAQVVVSQPFSINKDLTTWAREHFNSQSEFSQNIINGRSFEKIYDCSGVGCVTYYYTIQNDQAFGIATFAQGASKTEYESAISSILETLQFGNTANGTITKEDAIVKVKTIPEVADYIIRVPQAKVEVGGDDDDDFYLIQVFEVVKDHTATFNWYTVNKMTGEVKKEF